MGWQEIFIGLLGAGVTAVGVLSTWLLYTLNNLREQIYEIKHSMEERYVAAFEVVNRDLAKLEDVKRRVYESAVTQSAMRKEMEHVKSLVSNGLVSDLKQITASLNELQGRCMAYTSGVLQHGKKE